MQQLPIVQAISGSNLTQAEIASKLGISTVALSKKLHGKMRLNLDEVFYILRLLKLPIEEIPAFFPPEIYGGIYASS